MLLIEHYVGLSRIHGLGVFSAVDVEKGSKIWEFNPAIDIIIKRSQLSHLPKHVVHRIEMRAEYYEQDDFFLLGADGDSFMNHSDEPNLLSKGTEGFAARRINSGDEITCDYRSTRTLLFRP